MFSPANASRIRERTQQFGIDVWCLQEWRVYHRGKGQDSLEWALQALEPGCRLFQGPNTAILVTNPALAIVGGADHTERASRIRIRMPGTSQAWTIISVYLPAKPQERLAFMLGAGAKSSLLFSSLTAADVERTIIVGDFNESESSTQNVADQARSVNPWGLILSTLQPLVPIFRLLHPSKLVFSFWRKTADAVLQPSQSDADFRDLASSLVKGTRIDHVFLPDRHLHLVDDVLHLLEPGASDHCIVLLKSKTSVQGESSTARVPTWWALDRLAVRIPFFYVRMTSHLQSLPSKASPASWMRHMQNAQLAIFYDARKLLPRRALSNAAIYQHRQALDDLVLGSNNLQDILDASKQYEKARWALFPEERFDVLYVQPDIPIWPKRYQGSAVVPIPASEVSEFFNALYAEVPIDSLVWTRRSLSFLTASRVNFRDPVKLAADFTAEEVDLALRATKKDSGPGPNGLSFSVLKSGGLPLCRFLADVLNDVLANGGTFPSVTKARLLFKNKAGMSRKRVNDYRLLAVLDSDLRLVHSLLARRLHEELVNILPASQTGFVKGRQSSALSVRLYILAEANASKRLRRPGIHISQDQKKAYDKVHRAWVRLTLVNAGCPDRLLHLYDSLMADTSTVIAVDHGFTTRITLARGLLQGAPSSVILYLLAYQPFLDRWEATKSGIRLSFLGPEHHLSSCSYADNSEFFLGGEQDLLNFEKLRSTFDALSGSQLNVEESSVRLLFNGSRDPHWFASASTPYTVSDLESTFKTVGRLVRMDGRPSQDAIKMLDKAVQGNARLIRRHTNLFARAHTLQTFGYSKAWMLFEGPVDVTATNTVILAHTRSTFRDGNGLTFRPDILYYPKALGGLGLVNFLDMADACTAFSLTAALVGSDASLSSLVGDFLVHALHSRWQLSFATALVAPSAIGLIRDESYRRYSDRCLAALLRFNLDVIPTVDWSSLSPTEAASLPFFSTAYDFIAIPELDSACFEALGSVGLSSFAEFMWLAANSCPGDVLDASSALQCPSLYVAEAFMAPKVYAAHLKRSRPDKTRLTAAFKTLKKHWQAILSSWPRALAEKLISFVRASTLDTAVLRFSPVLCPILLRRPLLPPWRALSLAGVSLSAFRPKVGRSFLLPKAPLCPGGSPLPPVRGRRPEDEEGWIDVGEEGEDNAPLASSSSTLWRKNAAWSAIWPQVHRYSLPGKPRETWFLVLWGRAPMPKLKSHRRAPCYGCMAEGPTCDHVYLACPHALGLWKELSDVLADFLGLQVESLCMDFVSPSPHEVALGFPTLSSRLNTHQRLRLRLWFVICLDAYAGGIAAAERLAHRRTACPSSLAYARLKRQCIKRILTTIASFRFGPPIFTKMEVEAAWLRDNRLVTGDFAPRPELCSFLAEDGHPGPEDDQWEDEPRVATPPPQESCLPDGVRATAPTQDWLRKSTQCACCGRLKRATHRTLRLCGHCFRQATGVLPAFLASNRTLPCPSCGAIRFSTEEMEAIKLMESDAALSASTSPPLPSTGTQVRDKGKGRAIDLETPALDSRQDTAGAPPLSESLGQQGTPKLSFDRYNAMSQALNKTKGDPILYSMCNWGEDWPWLFATEIANSWRISGDIYPSFNRDDDRCPCTDITTCNLQGFHCSVAKILDFAASLGQKAYPGAWNDLDMLEVGNRGLSLDESLVHFSMWAMVKSPLILGNDLTKMTNQTRAIIKNKHVIDISQDPKGSPATRMWKKNESDGNTQLWKIGLSNGTYAVAVINVSESPKNMSISLEDVFYDEYLEGEDLAQESWTAYDLWKGVDFSKNPTQPVPMDQMKVGTVSGSIPEVTVPKHGIKLWKLVPASGEANAQKRSADGLDKVTRDFAEMKPSRIMGANAFL